MCDADERQRQDDGSEEGWKTAGRCSHMGKVGWQGSRLIGEPEKPGIVAEKIQQLMPGGLKDIRPFLRAKEPEASGRGQAGQRRLPLNFCLAAVEDEKEWKRERAIPGGCARP